MPRVLRGFFYYRINFYGSGQLSVGGKMKDVVISGLNFRHENAPLPLFDNINLHFSKGWTGITGSNGSGKTSLLRLITGEIKPVSGSIHTPNSTVYCSQEMYRMPDNFENFLYSPDNIGAKIMGELEIEYDWLYRWETLSFGERKRAQIGTALWLEPDVLALDEPSNHIDIRGRELLLRVLGLYEGTGVLVSHDRSLMNSLCSGCVFLDSGKAVLRPGGITKGAAEAEKEGTALAREKERLKKESTRLMHEAAVRRNRASAAHRKRSKRGLAPKDHDARDKKNLARITGKDGVDGKLLRQMEGRIKRTIDNLESAQIVRKRRLKYELPGKVLKRDRLAVLGPGSVPLGEDKQLMFNELVIRPEDRIAVTGRNGSGKTTLIKIFISLMNKEELLYLPQEIPEEECRRILESINGLSNKRKGFLFAVIDSLGSDPERLLYSKDPSPGEFRKLFFAFGIMKEPALVVMDEPTNHMDLPSVELLESALKSCPAALLLVSHDLSFLNAVTETVWKIETDPVKRSVVRVITG